MARHRAAQIDGVAISNVVPPVQQTLEWMCEKYFDVVPYSVEPGANVTMPLAVDNLREVGADRITKSVAAAALYGPPLIVVDLGTATTFDCVHAAGEFIGGANRAGHRHVTEALIARAARLYRVELACARRRRSGRKHRHQHPVRRRLRLRRLVDGVVDRMKAEMAAVRSASRPVACRPDRQRRRARSTP